MGAGNSGAEIAIELAPYHQTWLSGRDKGQEPTRAGSRLDHLSILWLMATRLTVKTALGRKFRASLSTRLAESLWGGCDERTLPPRASRGCRE